MGGEFNSSREHPGEDGNVGFTPAQSTAVSHVITRNWSTTRSRDCRGKLKRLDVLTLFNYFVETGANSNVELNHVSHLGGSLMAQ